MGEGKSGREPKATAELLDELLRTVVVAAEDRLMSGHDDICDYDPEAGGDQEDERQECTCGHGELRAAVGAVRESGVLG